MCVCTCVCVCKEGGGGGGGLYCYMHQKDNRGKKFKNDPTKTQNSKCRKTREAEESRKIGTQSSLEREHTKEQTKTRA